MCYFSRNAAMDLSQRIGLAASFHGYTKGHNQYTSKAGAMLLALGESLPCLSSCSHEILVLVGGMKKLSEDYF
jgi:hypothetical protein